MLFKHFKTTDGCVNYGIETKLRDTHGTLNDVKSLEQKK